MANYYHEQITNKFFKSGQMLLTHEVEELKDAIQFKNELKTFDSFISFINGDDYTTFELKKEYFPEKDENKFYDWFTCEGDDYSFSINSTQLHIKYGDKYFLIIHAKSQEYQLKISHTTEISKVKIKSNK
ncbi:MAG: hypothetical protein Ta2E_03730 [Mycoplasmoidaceae bacterium]|nr:MAG: hypothetical protein Ta2E_03730 [Mycoplasmoidaceae bacterium]